MKSIFLAVLILATARAEASVWQRDVQGAKGNHVDSPLPHPLAYFVRDPFLRNDTDDFCGDCSAAGKAKVHRQHRSQAEVRKVGALSGFAIYDVFYRFDGHIESGEIDWKSILVKVGPDRYREIYHLQPTAGKIEPSFLLQAGAERILATRILIPGTGNNYYEDYFWFSPAGAALIDMEALGSTLQSILPPGSGIWKGGGLDMGTLRFHSFVWKEGDSNCCPSGGAVDIKFRLEGGQLVVTGKHFDPSARPAD